ncbi:MAG: DsbA family protein [Rhizobiales bacterium]|nr:DsbA family protein [Hyphomicrobiales bacterium]
MLFTRRTILQTSGAATALAGLGVLGACSSESASNAAQAQPGPLKEMTLGNPEAKVKVIEYASMTCPHCAAFHAQTFHPLKEKYVDSGKILFAFREFPLDQVALTISVLARCAPEDKFFDVIDIFFKTQAQWRTSDNVLGGIFEIAKQLGFTQQSFNECLQNQPLIDGVNAIRKHGVETMKVDATPTFFINGNKVSGALSLEAFDKEIESYL